MTKTSQYVAPLLAQLPQEVGDFLQKIHSRGFFVTLVGGAVREFVREGRLPPDLDFEVRPYDPCEPAEFVAKMTELNDILTEEGFTTQLLPYSIVRVKVGKYFLELASPRVEVFKNSHSHRNFEAMIAPQLPYDEAFARRDFTINAMGVEMRGPKSALWIDPFGGEEDLIKGVLRPCGKNFFRDPVRFLRTIRFSMVFSLNIAPQIQENFREFNLSELVPHYYFYEGFKSGDFLRFNSRFFELTDQNKLKVSPLILPLRKLLGRTGEKNRPLNCKNQLVGFCALQTDLRDKDLEELAHTLGIGASFLKKWHRYGKLLQQMDHDCVSSLRKFFSEGGTFEESFHNNDFGLAFKVYHLRKELAKSGQNVLPEMERGLTLTSFPFEIFSLKENQAGKDLFQEILGGTKTPASQRARLQFFCHLKTFFG